MMNDPAFQKWAKSVREMAVRAATEPQEYQELHSPTEAVEVTLNSARRTMVEVCRRRVLDAQLWNAMRPEQAEAAVRIAYGFERVTAGVGIRQMATERRDRGQANPWDNAWWIIEDYWAWAKEAQRQKVRVSEVLDILAYGKSCNQVDAERRQRKGTARGNLFDGLDVYCTLRGW